VSKIADTFKSLFKSTIVHEIESALVSNIQSALPSALDDLIKEQNGESEIYHNMELDWSLPYAPKVTDKDLEFGIKGLFF